MGFRQFLVPFSGLFAISAWVISFWSNFLCKSVEFEPQESAILDSLPTLSFGLWNTKNKVVYQNNEGELFVANTCTKYPDSVSMDAYWKTAQAFSIIAYVFGFLAILLSCAMGFDVGKSHVKKAAGALYILVSLFQGLTLLQLSSDFCEDNPLLTDYVPDDGLYENECTWASGVKISIAATVLYFAAGLATCGIPTEEDGSEEEVEEGAVEKGIEQEGGAEEKEAALMKSTTGNDDDIEEMEEVVTAEK